MTMKMMKKLLFLGMLLLVAHVCYGQKRENQIFKSNGLYFKYVDYNCSSLRVIQAPSDSTQYTGAIVIPEHVEITDTLAEAVPYVWSPAVVSIDANAFRNTNITSVCLPQQLLSIGNSAFSGCMSLKKATFASVNALCQTTFANKEANPLYYAHHLYFEGQDSEVKTIEVPNGVKSIGIAAFAGGSEIVGVIIPATVTSIGNDAFLGCSKLYSVDYPSIEALTHMEYGNSYSNPISLATMIKVQGKEIVEVPFDTDVNPYALAGAKWLEKITLKTGVTTIGQSAFNGCTKLEDVIINGNVVSISQDAFKGCSKLSNIILPPTLESIGKGAFRDCTSLESIVIPNSVTSLGEESFLRCYKLKKADIQAQVNTIPGSMFKECGVLWDVTLSDEVERIESSAFSSCNALTDLPKGGKLTHILDYAFNGCKGLVELHLPTTINVVGQYAFSSCSNLTDLIIPQEASDLTIRGNAFASTNNLNHIYSYAMKAPSAQPSSFGENASIELFYPEGATGYDQEPWVYFNRENLSSKTITYYVDNEIYHQDEILVGKPVVPYAEPTKTDWVFSGWMENIPSLMPNEDLAIHGFFMTRQNINTLTYALRSDNKEAKVVADKEAYQNLTDVTVPDSVDFGGNKYFVATIDSIAFRGSRNLQKIVMSDSLLTIGHAAFAECPDINKITIPKKITVLADSLFYKCTNLVSVEMTETVKKIGASAFSNCTALNLNALPSKLESLGNLAFTKCDGLDHIVLPKSIKTMGTQVFLQCTGLTSAAFDKESTLTQLPNNTFQRCTSLTRFTLAPSMTSIGAEAFSGCTALYQLVLDEGIEAINANAFNSCTGLENITLPQSIETIGTTAFGWCKNIQQITVNKPTPPIASGNAFTNETYTNANLFVSNVEAYRSTSPWSMFEKMSTNEKFHLKYIVDGKECADLLMAVGSVITSHPDSVSAEGRSFSGWNGEPSVMPGKDITVTGAFNYHRLYQDVDTKETLYEDSLFYNEPIATHMPNLDKAGFRFEIQNEVINMPAKDTIISVKYYKTEADYTHNGILYHIYTEGEEPHAELMPTWPLYSTENIIVPDSIPYFDDKYAVTVIRTDAFKNCNKVKTVNLPNTIIQIGTQAFRSCGSLTEITIPKSVTTLGNEIFLRCYNLKSVHFDNESVLESLPANMFMDCTALETIDLPASLKTIGSETFRGCKILTEITIPENVTAVGEGAFAGCDKLEKI